MAAKFIQIGEPAHDAERQAVRFLVEGLPESFTVYGSAWLVERSGVVYELDAVIVASHAIFIVEIKGYRGRTEGTDNDWWLPEKIRNPLKLNRLTSQVLKSHLRNVSYQSGQVWTEGLVFLSATTDVGVCGPASNDRVHTRKTILAALQDPALIERLSQGRARTSGLLSLGTRGEKLYGKRNFFELYAVFTAPPVMRVQHDKEDVGYIQALFVTMHDASKGPLCFRLSGRAWEVGQIDWGKGVLNVRPAEHGRVPSWLGLPGVLSNALCQGMLDVLIHERQEGAWLSKVAAAELAAMRESYDGLLREGTAPLEDHPDGIQWHTFAGGAVNRLLAAGLEQESGKKWVAGNLSLRCKDIAFTAAGDAIRSLADLRWERVAADAARDMARGMLSKFQSCLPEETEDRLLSERLLDQPGTLRFLATVKVNGTRRAQPACASLTPKRRARCHSSSLRASRRPAPQS